MTVLHSGEIGRLRDRSSVGDSDRVLLLDDGGTIYTADKDLIAGDGPPGPPGEASIDFAEMIFVSENGDDANNGEKIIQPKETIASALAAAQAKNPSATNIVGIRCDDGSVFTGNFSIPSYVAFEMPNATFTNTSGVVLSIADSAFANIGQVIASGSSTIGIRKNAGSIGSRVRAQNIVAQNGATAISHTGSSARLVVESSAIQGNSTLVLNNSTANGRLIIRTNAINVNADNAVAVHQNSSTNDLFIEADIIGPLNGVVANSIGIDCDAGMVIGYVSEMDTVTDIDLDGGSVNIFESKISGNINVASGATLRARVLEFGGTLTNNGTINGVIAGNTYGDTTFLDDITVNGTFGFDTGTTVDTIATSITSGGDDNTLVTTEGVSEFVASDTATHLVGASKPNASTLRFTRRNNTTFDLDVDQGVDDIGVVINARNSNSTAIPVHTMVVDAGSGIFTAGGIQYADVNAEKGETAELSFPTGITVVELPATTSVEASVKTQGLARIVSTDLNAETLSANSKIFITRSGSGTSEKWIFTTTDSSATYFIGRFVQFTGVADTYDIYLDFSLIEAHELVNEVETDLRKPLAFWKEPIIEFRDNPPSSPSTGDRYIPLEEPSGDWLGRRYNLIEWDGSAWIFESPQEGMVVYNEALDKLYTYYGTTDRWDLSSSVGVKSNGTSVSGRFDILNIIGDHNVISGDPSIDNQINLTIDSDRLALTQSSGSLMIAGQGARISHNGTETRAEALNLTAVPAQFPEFWASESIVNNGSGTFVREGRIDDVAAVELTSGKGLTSPSEVTAGDDIYWDHSRGRFTVNSNNNENPKCGDIISASFVEPQSTFWTTTTLQANTGISTANGANGARNQTLLTGTSGSAITYSFQLPNLNQSQPYTDPFEVGDTISLANPSGSNITWNITIQPGGTLQNTSGVSVSSIELEAGDSLVVERIAGNIWRAIVEDGGIVEVDLYCSVLQLQSYRDSILEGKSVDPTIALMGFINGGETATVSNSSVSINPFSVRSDDNTVSFMSNSSIAVNMPADLDTGSEESRTHYYIWLVHNETTGQTRGIFSKSFSNPSQPTGFNKKRLIGYVRNDGDSNFRPFRALGSGNFKNYVFLTEKLETSNATISSRTAIDVSDTVPIFPTGFPLINGTFEFADTSGNLLLYHDDQTTTFSFIPGGSQFGSLPNIHLNASGEFHVNNSSGSVTGLYVKVLGFAMEI